MFDPRARAGISQRPREGKGRHKYGISLSVLLIAVGAVLAWAVNAEVSGIDIQVAGVILVIVGVIGLIASLVFGRAGAGSLGATGRLRHDRDRARYQLSSLARFICMKQQGGR